MRRPDPSRQPDMMHRRLQPFLLTAVLMISCVIATGASAKPLRILLTNDDGYLAPGIRAMRTTLLDAGHQVFLIAPESNQSGSGTSISPQGIMVQAHGHGVWSVEGRPADAVRYALGHLMKDAPPDLVISGINFGQMLALMSWYLALWAPPSRLCCRDFPPSRSLRRSDCLRSNHSFPQPCWRYPGLPSS